LGIPSLKEKKLLRNITLFIILLFAISNAQNDLYDQGIKSQNDDSHIKAIELFSEAILKNTDSSDVFFKRGVSYYYLKKYEQAISDFNTSINNKVVVKTSYYNRGLCYERLNKLEKANNDYKTVLEMDSTFYTVYGMVATNYFNLKNYTEAIGYFNKLVSGDSTTALNYVKRGNTYDVMGKFDLALVDYYKAIYLDSTSSSAYFNRGIAYRSQSSYEQAIKDISKAISLSNANPNYYYNRGIAYAKNGTNKKAIEDFFIYLKYNSNKNGDLLSVYNYIKSLGFSIKTPCIPYTDESETFSITLPKSWNVKKIDDDKTSQLFVSLEKIVNPSDQYTVGLTANFIRRISKTYENLKTDEQIINAWTNATISELQKNKEFEIISSGHWIIDNYKGYLFDIKFHPEKATNKIRTYNLILAYNDNLIVVTLEAPEASFDNYTKIFYEGISSIKIL